MLPRATVLFSILLPQGIASFSPPQSDAFSRPFIRRALEAIPQAAGTTAATSIFPVLRRIEGIDWEGECRYVDADLRPASGLKLFGGVRYDLDAVDATCSLSSFLTFPNGRTRRVAMAGRRGTSGPSLRLDPVEEGGPIYMVLTELYPDTVLLNEVEGASGRVVMTASLSLVDGGRELVQVSHEVGDGKTPIEGHQVWRLRKAVPKGDTAEDNDGGGGSGNRGDDDDLKDAYRGTTGR